jgi:hypothetical protein
VWQQQQQLLAAVAGVSCSTMRKTSLARSFNDNVTKLGFSAATSAGGSSRSVTQYWLLLTAPTAKQRVQQQPGVVPAAATAAVAVAVAAAAAAPAAVEGVWLTTILDGTGAQHWSQRKEVLSRLRQ